MRGHRGFATPFAAEKGCRPSRRAVRLPSLCVRVGPIDKLRRRVATQPQNNSFFKEIFVQFLYEYRLLNLNADVEAHHEVGQAFSVD